MSNVPSSPKVAQIQWFESHLPLWTATPTAFGTTAAAITALTTAVTNARKAYNNAQAARDAAKHATTDQDQMLAAMLVMGRDQVNLMKSFIANANNPALWAQAGIEPNAAPGTAPAPTAPFELSAGVDSQGDVIVRWKASQPQGVTGVIYSVRRSLDGGDYTLLDSVGEKEFVDDTVPVGTHMVTYAVKAKRGRQSSEWSTALEIRFGRVGGGGLTIMSTTSKPSDGIKMAA